LQQIELAERVAVSKQYMHQLETRQRSPSDDMLEALAATLLVEKSFFFKPVEPEIAQGDFNFRKLESSRTRDIEQVIAHSALLGELVRLLEEYLVFPRPNFPRQTPKVLEDVERAAEHTRIHWGLTADRPISSTIRVAENAGAIVVKFVGVSQNIDALSVLGPRPMIVRASEKESPTRLRFDIAHEIGHLLLHQSTHNFEHSDVEHQANRFASAFLLPKKPFQRVFPRGRRLDWQAIFAIKREWGVSAQAIIRRAHDLNLIDAAQYRSGNVFISKQGYKRAEPFEPLQVEETELLRNALIELQDAEGMLPKDVAHALNVQPVLVGKLLGIPMPDLREADSRMVVNLNARLDWAKSKFLA
jgi:Zn-dependent peptidase ImmA (M78 family)